jgi:hypothetical protein
VKTYTASTTIRATTEQVWALIANPSDFSWRSNIKSASDGGARYSETSSRTGYATDYTITRDEPNRRRDTALSHVDGVGTMSLVLTANPDSTTTVEIVGQFDFNGPKVIRPLVDIFMRREQKTYLKDLEKTLT